MNFKMQNSDLTKFLLDRNIDQKPKDQLASAYLCEAESLLKTLESDPTNPDHEETRSLAIAFTLKSFDLSLPAKNSDIIFRASQIYWRLCSENFNKNGSDHIPTLLKFSTALEQSNHSNVSWRIQILLQISNIYYKLNQYSESGKFCLCAVRLSKTLYSRVVYLKYLKSCVELLYKCGSLRDKGSVSQLENEVAGDEFMQFFLLVELCCLGIRSTDVLDPSYVESKLKSSKTVDDRVIVRWAVVNYARFLRQNKKMEFARTILDIKPGRDSSSWVYALQKYAEIEMQLSDSSTSNEIDTMLTELENILKLCVSKSYPLFVIEDGCILGWEILCNIPGKNYDNRKFVKQKLSFLRLATEILEKSDSRLTSLQSTIHLELSKIYDVIGNPSIAKRHLEAAKISDNETIKKDENVSGSNDFEQAMLLIEKAKTRSPDKLCKKMLEKAFQLIIPGYTFLPPFSIIESNSEYIAHAESISNSPKLCQFLFDLLNLWYE
ncbi:Cilia- and flagella-associated protein 46 [Nowakowskiella sp. JEL0407]|nr:Cilia- and flagella-associated protein 46 [Nowakowskiella sp. JEL0407]